MKFFILTAFATVAWAAEVYQESKYQSTPTYVQPAYKTYEESYEYPPQPYTFEYAVQDDYTYTSFARNEYSNGKVTSGSYRVALPDGRIQTVTYKDEGYGLTADVTYEGTAQHPEYKPTYKPTTYEHPKGDYKNEAYKQPKVVYTQPKVEYKADTYEQSKYVTAPAYRPTYQPAPAAYKQAPVVYTTAASPYSTTEYATTVNTK